MTKKSNLPPQLPPNKQPRQPTQAGRPALTQARQPTKTEFSRWLNDHGAEVPKLAGDVRRYFDGCEKARTIRGNSFGFWLRTHNPAAFERLYRDWFVKNPHLVDQIYNDMEDAPL